MFKGFHCAKQARKLTFIRRCRITLSRTIHMSQVDYNSRYEALVIDFDILYITYVDRFTL